ncbi:hypothetical protein B0H13DRAFT_2304158 [Mycena leptocephala]|nr:hypothetical protein B0H13DRAFT_2304158 [Mycena leptocephala]
MAAKNLFFILYVRLPLLFPSLLSPSLQLRLTGKPNGVRRAPRPRAGTYLLCAALSVKYVFDVHPGDRFWAWMWGGLRGL